MKNKFALFLSLLVLALLLILAACSATATEEAAPSYSAEDLARFGTLPDEASPTEYEMSEELIVLGRMLYYDPRISANGDMSCNTCHGLNNYGVDGLRFSFGHSGNPVGRNSPTVYNAALQIAQFWDGRAADVEAQAAGPMLSSGEMGAPSADYVVEALKSIPDYLTYFEAAFPGDPDPITFDHVIQAIGAFERGLLTPGRFDEFLAGDETALTEQEQRGLALFVDLNCIRCHDGPALGGGSFEKLGAAEPYTTNDVGRFAVTGDEADMYAFKVPTLRNIAQTGPYLHDGSIPTLDDMVQLMVRYQLGEKLTDDQLDDMVAFLRSLTGELPPAEYSGMPELPPSPSADESTAEE